MKNRETTMIVCTTGGCEYSVYDKKERHLEERKKRLEKYSLKTNKTE